MSDPVFNPEAIASGIAGALGLDSAPQAQPDTPAPAAASEPAAQPDPLSYTLPDSDGVPQKFRNQPLSKVIESQAEAERIFHENQAKLKSTSYELELAKSANKMLKEQFETLRPAAPPPAAPDPWDGMKLEEEVILNPRAVLNRALAIGEQNATRAAKAEAEKIQATLQKKDDERMALHAAVTAAEAAREKLGKAQEEWMPLVHDLAPAVFQAGRQFDPNAYVDEYNARKTRYSDGPAQTIEVKVQGQAPVIAKASTAPAAAAPSRPSSLTERQFEQASHYAELFGFDRDSYVKRVAESLQTKEKV